LIVFYRAVIVGAQRSVRRRDMEQSIVRIGDVEIRAVVDVRTKGPCAALFPSVPAEAWRAYADFLVDDCANVPVTVTSFVMRSEGKTILVDTGIGAKGRALIKDGRLPDALAEAGVRPEDVDIVLTTHIHIDHVGWHTTLQGEAYVPTFPNAKYVFVRDEWDYFTAPDVANAAGNEHVVDCVLPLQGNADVAMVEGEHRLTKDLTLLPAPGHTPAHSAIAIMSQGEAGVIIGDLAHHPAQLIETEWCPVFDMNPALAAKSREALAKRIEEQQLLVLAGHFAHPGFGRLVRVDGRRAWRPLQP
jgi:glyoxylase-like metal-dependent hydrolase (beta-lactamase superfamily II)